jgi:hypothetical protein
LGPSGVEQYEHQRDWEWPEYCKLETTTTGPNDGQTAERGLDANEMFKGMTPGQQLASAALVGVGTFFINCYQRKHRREDSACKSILPEVMVEEGNESEGEEYGWRR